MLARQRKRKVRAHQFGHGLVDGQLVEDLLGQRVLRPRLEPALVGVVDELGARDVLAPELVVVEEVAVQPLDELTQRRLGDLAGSTLSSWRLLERFDAAKPVVRVYNPDYEKHGWQSTHTAVEILHGDIPFLVDSVRMELNRHGYSIHTLQNSVFSVKRGKAGELQQILTKGSSGKDVRTDSLLSGYWGGKFMQARRLDL